MPRFVSLLGTNHKPFYVNPQSVTYFFEIDEGTRIHFIGTESDYRDTTETPDAVAEALGGTPGLPA